VAQEWYYAKDGEKLGPITAAQLKALASSSELAPSDLIWREGMPEWTPASKAKGLFPQQGEPPPLPSEKAGPPPPPADAGPPSPPSGRPTGEAHSANSAGFWGSMFDSKLLEPWTGGQMAVLVIGSLLVGLFGVVVDIVGLTNKARPVQGGVLLAIGALGVLLALAATGAMKESPPPSVAGVSQRGHYRDRHRLVSQQWTTSGERRSVNCSMAAGTAAAVTAGLLPRRHRPGTSWKETGAATATARDTFLAISSHSVRGVVVEDTSGHEGAASAPRRTRRLIPQTTSNCSGSRGVASWCLHSSRTLPASPLRPPASTSDSQPHRRVTPHVRPSS
jgi:hypothetical protein